MSDTATPLPPADAPLSPLHELIVRVLMGQDPDGRARLDAAAAADPELAGLWHDLEDVVHTLSDARGWQAVAPSAELTARIRSVVVARMPVVPREFERVLVPADLLAGRRRRLWVARAVALLAVLVAAGLWIGSRLSSPQRGALAGRTVLAWKAPQPWPAGLLRSGDAGPAIGGLLVPPTSQTAAGTPSATRVAAQAFAAPGRPIWVQADLNLSDLGPSDRVLIGLARAEPPEPPAPLDARQFLVALSLTHSGLVLVGPDGGVLASQAEAIGQGRFISLRLELAADWLSVSVNRESLYRRPAANLVPIHDAVRPVLLVQRADGSAAQVRLSEIQIGN